MTDPERLALAAARGRIYATWSPAEMAWTVTQKWLHGDLLGPA